jgi:hypothetical protein
LFRDLIVDTDLEFVLDLSRKKKKNSFLICSYVYKNIEGRLVLVDKALLEELV